MKLVTVTATLNPKSTFRLWYSWAQKARTKEYEEVWFCSLGDRYDIGKLVQESEIKVKRHQLLAPGITGVVPSFARACRKAQEVGADIIACLHDDVRIDREGWDDILLAFFKSHKDVVLVGFGGATGVGALGFDYTQPFPYADQNKIIEALARQDFRSNMIEAVNHGSRETTAMRVACLDGFSLIGRTEFMVNTWNKLEKLGMVHHAYDTAFGLEAARQGEEVWLVPLQCHHAGGVTAVGKEYQEWAKTKTAEGDIGFWKESHRILYYAYGDLLPLRVES